MTRKETISENIKNVRERIAEAAVKSGRKPEDIKLVCVTKNFPVSDINYAIECGITCIGENRVQELLSKLDYIAPKEVHLIGHLQTNKVKQIVGKTDLIESVDSAKVLLEIEKRSEQAGVFTNVLFEVNTSDEASKTGAARGQIYEMCELAGQLRFVSVRGLMTIAPIYIKDVSNTLHFGNTRELYLDIAEKKYNNISMDFLSMGMSGDFEEAIRCGSNMVRLGSAIFGKRIY